LAAVLQAPSRERAFPSKHFSQWQIANSALQSRGGDGWLLQKRRVKAAAANSSVFPCTKSAIIVEGHSPLLVTETRPHRREKNGAGAKTDSPRSDDAGLKPGAT